MADEQDEHDGGRDITPAGVGETGAGGVDAPFILSMDGVTVRYGAVAALTEASLGVRAGEVVAVMGPNGAGKSTVLKAVMGLAPVSHGRVSWRGAPLTTLTHEIVKQGIAFVPQGRRLFTHLTIEENLEMGCPYLQDPAERRRRMERAFALFPVLYEKRRDRAQQMSGGQQQMLALGRGLMANPDLLLLDEPTLGLAPNIVKEVFRLVSVIAEQLGTTIMVVEHNIKGALDIVGRAYVLNNGRVVFEGTPAEVLETNILEEVFLGKAMQDEDEP